jgi:hypothetical protein
MKRSLVLASLILCTGAAAGSLLAQENAPRLEFPSASPPATVKQRVGITDIEISYSRPSARGRTIFGGVVPYGEVWRTGANQATKISFSTPVKLNGTEIPAGDYELFTIPNRDEWTVIIHRAQSQWGAYQYNQANDVARVSAKPVTLPNPIETFTIAVSSIQDQSATLYLAWERTRVPVQLEVDVVGQLRPRVEAVMASDAAQKPYAQAAMFYLNHGFDLDQAEKWMQQALAANPDAFYFGYHHARILAKQGKKQEAIAAAEKSLAAARKAGGSLGSEYIRLNEGLLATLR